MVALRLVPMILACFFPRSASALSHDGLWVFADRILANRIFADRVLADWRRRHWGWLLHSVLKRRRWRAAKEANDRHRRLLRARRERPRRPAAEQRDELAPPH